jgi:ferredoxin, 2Fe-2S
MITILLRAPEPNSTLGLGPNIIKLAAQPGQTLMQAAVAANVAEIAADCGGCLSCATCHVVLPPESASRFAPASQDEQNMLEMTAHPRESGSRLCCQLKLQAHHDGLVVQLVPAQY